MAEIEPIPMEPQQDRRALVAVDVSAESCRVSVLRWIQGEPVITMVNRFANAPRESDRGLR